MVFMVDEHVDLFSKTVVEWRPGPFGKRDFIDALRHDEPPW